MTDKVQKIREEVERLHGNPYYMMAVKDVLEILDMQEEPVSEDLEIAANEWDEKASFTPFCMTLDDKGNPNGVRQDYTTHAESFKAGAKWQKENLWKPADGDDLPEIDREVVAFQEIFPTDVDVTSLLKIVIAHRPNKYTKVWNSDLGEEQVVEIERHGKGGWNIPDVKYWLDVEFPKELEL